MSNVFKCIDGVTFELRENYKFEWLNKFGKVFCVFDQQDSGNICFGIENEEKKCFIKYAGAPTINYNGECKDAVARMKKAIPIYEDLKHPNLITLIEHFEQDNGYSAIYEWIDGECLRSHWNFDKYPKYTYTQSPNYRFNQLDTSLKLDCLDKIFSFHQMVADNGYVAIDFYDGSIIYDFRTNTTTICDIDYYVKSPYINDMGRMWGSSRFMSPEEFEKGAIIDEITNVFTMGAVAFEFLGSNSNRNIENWQVSEKLFRVAKKATSKERNQRYQSIKEFNDEWNNALI